jgi:hypothetical protein
MMYKKLLLLCLLPWAAVPCVAVDYTFSGFGTIGYTQSDSAYRYDRFISDQGSFRRDTVFGLQGTAEFNRQWNTTLQAIASPSSNDDNRTEVSLLWAFVSYRPNNDWLLRAGKMRMPLYLYSENMNVGAAYEFMHLPTEVYSTAPTTDFTGLSFTRTWGVAAGELSLDGYAGVTKIATRELQDANGTLLNGDLRTRSGGLTLMLRRDDDLYRLGLMQAYIDVPTTNFSMVPSASAAPGVATDSFTLASDGFPGAIGMIDSIDTRVILLGADVGLGNGWRVVGEIARRYARNLVTPKNSVGSYVSILKKVGPWTPYLTLGRLLSDSNARHDDDNNFDDQSSVAMGLSYSLSHRSKVKAELMRLQVGGGSTLVDHPESGVAISNQGINVLSVSYSLAF